MNFEFLEDERTKPRRGGPLKNLIGCRFGRLVVIKRSTNRGGRVMWFCACDCGKEKSIKSSSLLEGRTKSCGCRIVEAAIARVLVDNMSRSPEKQAWYKMLRRCHDPEHFGYLNYGARGITVCQRWRDSFLTFYEDMGPRPSAKHSIDRIDNNKGYEPENCRWATASQQNGNQRRSIIIEFQGRKQCLAHWAKEYGITAPLLYYRVKAGWDLQTALTKPIVAIKSHRSQK